jgi:hypothetical protein
LDSTGLGQGPVSDCCECGNEPSGSCTTELVSLFEYFRSLVFNSQLIQFAFLSSSAVRFTPHTQEKDKDANNTLPSTAYCLN